jgi:RNA polymerase sigma-70 factor (ECF subfamily)
VAADVLQEAFLQAHLHWDQLRAYENQPGWVMRVATNRLRNEERSLRRGAAALVRLRGRENTAPYATPPDAARLHLWTAILKLPVRRRLILTLYYLEDQSVADIAALLRISAGSVTKQLHRSREALRAELGD